MTSKSDITESANKKQKLTLSPQRKKLTLGGLKNISDKSKKKIANLKKGVSNNVNNKIDNNNNLNVIEVTVKKKKPVNDDLLKKIDLINNNLSDNNVDSFYNDSDINKIIKKNIDDNIQEFTDDSKSKDNSSIKDNKIKEGNKKDINIAAKKDNQSQIAKNIDNDLFDKFDVVSKLKNIIDQENNNKESENQQLKKDIAKKSDSTKDNLDQIKEKYKKVAQEDNYLLTKSYKKSKKSKKSFGENNNNENAGINFYKNRGVKSKNKIDKSDYKKITKEVIIPEQITVAELSTRMAEKSSDVIKKLFTMGMAVTINQTIDSDTSILVVEEFGHKYKLVNANDVESNLINDNNYDEYESKSRPPVVTIMGHVDHGKTSLLDSIRSSNIIDSESGGITQHIGAFRVKTKNNQYITFLDTPGHAAFTSMRARGANVTDIVILVVAADDGIKDQTIEAINHAKAAKVPIIVAINKIDKEETDIANVKNQLLSNDVILEEFGGEVMHAEISAKKRINLDKLEEQILLQAEIMDLKATYDHNATGTIIESRVDNHKGVIASILIKSGKLNISDIVVSGTSYGRVKKMLDDKGNKINTIYPSYPVELFGFNKLVKSGNSFHVVNTEKEARDLIAYRLKKERNEKLNINKNNIFANDDKINLNFIIKSDVVGSSEAIVNNLKQLESDDIKIKIIHFAAGNISESDINLAKLSSSILIAFNIKTDSNLSKVIRDNDIKLISDNIIYNVIDEVKLHIDSIRQPEFEEKLLGKALVRKIFKLSSNKIIAGCIVESGVIKRNSKVKIVRDKEIIYETNLNNLKRFKENVKEVIKNTECGISLDNFDDVVEGDIIESYEVTKNK